MFFFQMRVNLAEEVVGVASKAVAKSDSYEKKTWKHGEFQNAIIFNGRRPSYEKVFVEKLIESYEPNLECKSKL